MVNKRTSAFVYMDVILSMALLGGGILVSMTFFRNEARAVRNTHERLSAMMIAESELERLRALPPDQIQIGKDMPLQSSLPAADRMKNFSETLTVSLDKIGLKVATIRVEWESSRGRREHVETQTWLQGEAKP